MLLNNQEITEEIRGKKMSKNKWQWKHYEPKPMGCSKNSSNREVYSNKILLQETRKISTKQLKITPKSISERRTKKTLKLAERKES